MPWWSWILIWIALVSLSLLFFGVLGVRLYRQAMTTLEEFGEAAERFSRMPSPSAPEARREAVDADAAASTNSGPQPVPGDAVFASPARMRHDYHASKSARQNARRLRRIQRRTDRGQPQALRDIESRWS